MDQWLDEWLDYHSDRLKVQENGKKRMQNFASTLLRRRFWLGRN